MKIAPLRGFIPTVMMAMIAFILAVSSIQAWTGDQADGKLKPATVSVNDGLPDIVTSLTADANVQVGISVVDQSSQTTMFAYTPELRVRVIEINRRSLSHLYPTGTYEYIAVPTKTGIRWRRLTPDLMKKLLFTVAPMRLSITGRDPNDSDGDVAGFNGYGHNALARVNI